MHLVAPRTTSGLWLCFECLWAAASGEICSHDPSKCRDCRVLPNTWGPPRIWGWRCLCCVCYVWEAWLLRTRQYLPARCTTNSSLQSLQDFDPSEVPIERSRVVHGICSESVDLPSSCHKMSHLFIKRTMYIIYIYIYIQIQWHICTYLYQSAPLNMEFLLTRITTASTAPGDHWHIVHRGHPTDKTEGEIWRDGVVRVWAPKILETYGDTWRHSIHY